MSETLNPHIEKQATGLAESVRFEPGAGTHIDEACKEAAALSISKGVNVVFKFNDTEVVATPDKSWKQLSAEWNAEFQRKADEYRNSPEGKASAHRRKLDIQNNQLQVDTLIAVLPARLGHGGLDDAIDWLCEYQTPADDIAVERHAKLVADLFEAHGYKENEHIGQKPEWFNTRERMGRYIIGQAINCLRIGTPPHGITHSFAGKYQALPVPESCQASAESEFQAKEQEDFGEQQH